MLKPIDRIDTFAQEVARSVELYGFALDGLFERTVRENPSVQGIRDFNRAAVTMMQEFHHQALGKLAYGHMDLQASLSDSERAYATAREDHALDVPDASEAFWGAMGQVRMQYAKRLREIVTARAYGTDTFKADPKVMTRSGRRWNFVEYAYLTARRLLVDRYNEIKIGYIVSIGGTQFVLDTQDPALIDEVYEVDDYPALADDLFHPRTSKLVGGIYVST